MWSIHFIPNETDHIDVTIDGKFWHTWRSQDGNVTVPLSFNQFNQKIHVFGVGEEGKNGCFEVMWNGQNKQTMEFDKEYDHDVEH